MRLGQTRHHSRQVLWQMTHRCFLRLHGNEHSLTLRFGQTVIGQPFALCRHLHNHQQIQLHGLRAQLSVRRMA